MKIKPFNQFLNEFEIEGDVKSPPMDVRGLLLNIIDKLVEVYEWGNIKLTIQGENYYTYGFDDEDKDVYNIGIESDKKGNIISFSYRPYNELIYNISSVTPEQYDILQLIYKNI